MTFVGAVLVYFEVYRVVVLYRLLETYSFAEPVPHFLVLWNSFRFDAVTVGFLIAPLWIAAFLGKSLFNVLKIAWIFVVVSLLIGVTTFDIQHFADKGSRWRGVSGDVESEIAKFVLVAPGETFGNLVILGILLMVLLKMYMIQMRSRKQAPRDPIGIFFPELISRLLLSLICLLLLGRGSVGQHHLRREDAMIVSSVNLQEWIFNPIWIIGKE